MRGAPMPNGTEGQLAVIGPVPGVQYDRAVGPFNDVLYDLHLLTDMLYTASLRSYGPKKVEIRNDPMQCCTYMVIWTYTYSALETWERVIRLAGLRATPYIERQGQDNVESGELYVWVRLGER